jgi:hypothetical protein
MIYLCLVCALAALSLPPGSARAALEQRLDGKAYYDTVLDITWYADANAAAGTAWDDGLLGTDGWLTWYSAADWVSNLVVDGIDGWRMANMDVNNDQVVVDCPQVSELECRDNEYGYMYHQNGITAANPGPFAASLQAYGYWSGTLYPQIPDTAWLLTFDIGIQHPLGMGYDRHVWAVRDGDIVVPVTPVSDPGTVLTGGPVSQLGSGDGLATQADMDAAGIPPDTGFNNVGGYFDFIVTGVAGPTVNVVLGLSTTLPENAIYRKWTGVSWVPFITDGINVVASTGKVGGVCPVPGDAAYNHNNGLGTGDDCIQLTLEDGGQYDWDATVGTIYDPGGVAIAQTSGVISIVPSASGGCSISSKPVKFTDRAGWLLIAGFILMLGMRHRKSGA